MGTVGPEGPEAGIYYGSWAQLLRVIPRNKLPQTDYHYRVAATEAEATAKETAASMAMHMRAGAVFRVVGR